MTKPLSPAAQAVYDAVLDICPAPADEIAAATLRAVADQVVPIMRTPWNSTLTPIISAREVRAKFLAIAVELEGSHG